MQVTSKSLLILGLMFASLTVDAINYVGIDYKSRDMRGRNYKSYAMREVFGKSYTSAEFYVTHRFDDDVGINLGLESSKTTKKRHVFVNNEMFLGDLALSGQRTDIRARIQAAHVDVTGFIKIAEKFEAVGQLGFALMQVKTNASVFNGVSTRDINASHNINCIPRLGFGVQYFTNYKLGIRVLANWEGTNSLHMKLTDEDGLRHNINPFRQSWSIALGLVRNF